MGDLGPFAILAFVWWILSIVGGSRKKQQQRHRPLPGQRPPVPQPAERSAQVDLSQLEGSRLEQILRGMEQALDPEALPPAPTAPSPGGWDTGVEEGEEVVVLSDYRPAVESQEDFSNFERPEREVIVLGGDQEELQRRRMKYAEVRTHALTKADHDRFDLKVRGVQVVPLVSREEPTTERVKRFRQAMVWREVLGPPVALRGEERF